MRTILLSACFCLFLMLTAGCSSAPDIVSTEKVEGERYSADEIRRQTVDQPFLLSGDFFRERERDPETTIDPSRAFSRKGSKKEAPSEPAPPAAEKQPLPEKKAPPTETAPSAPSLEAEPRHAVKIAMVFDHDAVPEDRRQRVRSILTQTASGHPVVVADPEKVREMLAASGCLEQKDLRCIAERLGIYPGVRMLMLVEWFQWPDALPGPARTRISVVDTGLGYRYPPMEISGTVQNTAYLDGFIQGALHQALGFAVAKSRVMPWFCRAFSTDENQLYVSAGEKSGLKAGDALKVSTPGKLVMSPTGLPAGWAPGMVRGKVLVETLFGRDFAVCSLVEGAMPAPGDLLMAP